MFKVGDRVRRIIAGNQIIRKNGVYTVKAVFLSFVLLEEDPFVWYDSKAFVLDISKIEKAKKLLEKNGYIVTEKPKPVEFVRYFNVYHNDVGCAMSSRKEADQMADTLCERTACKRVVFTEGEFDE